MNFKNSKKEIFVHIGLYKTGTSFLQNEVFPKMDLNYIDREQFLYDKILLKSGKNLISCEELSGNIYGKNIYSRLLLLNGLKQTFNDVKIIVCLRDIEEITQSLYTQYIRKGGTERFFEFRKKMIKSPMLDYDLLKKHLFQIFGKDNVLILEYEDLKQNAKEFVEKISSFIGVKAPSFTFKKHNVSVGEKQLKLGRLLNHLIDTEDKDLGGRKGFFSVRYLMEKLK